MTASFMAALGFLVDAPEGFERLPQCDHRREVTGGVVVGLGWKAETLRQRCDVGLADLVSGPPNLVVAKVLSRQSLLFGGTAENTDDGPANRAMIWIQLQNGDLRYV